MRLREWDRTASSCSTEDANETATYRILGKRINTSGGGGLSVSSGTATLNNTIIVRNRNTRAGTSDHIGGGAVSS